MILSLAHLFVEVAVLQLVVGYTLVVEVVVSVVISIENDHLVTALDVRIETLTCCCLEHLVLEVGNQRTDDALLFHSPWHIC